MLPHGNKLEKFLEGDRTHEVFAIFIVMNAIVLGLETSLTAMASFGSILTFLDQLFLFIFVLELVLRIIAGGPRFFKNGWHVFDAVIILIALAPAAGVFSALRVLRVFRLLRLITLFPNMGMVVSAVLRAIPGIVSVAGILILLFYIAAIVAFNLFSQAHPDYFGSLGGSMYTLFQLMIADDWGQITRPILQTHPHAYLFFIPLMIIMTFTVLNLFFALIVNAMQGAAEAENKGILDNSEALDPQEEIILEVKEIKLQLAQIKQLLNKQALTKPKKVR